VIESAECKLLNSGKKAEGGCTMPSYVMVTRVSPEFVRSPQTLEELEKKAMDKVRAHCPNVKWLHSYAILGPYDYLDIFEAPDNETAAKVSTLIRAHGRAHSEIWVATDWKRFKQMLRGLGPEPAAGGLP
jgi:uncharacterized protein with GYD domain